MEKNLCPHGADILLGENIINEQVNKISYSDKCFGKNDPKWRESVRAVLLFYIG